MLIEPVSGKPLLQRLSDLPQPEVQRVALGQVAVEPAGRYARQAIEKQRLWPLVQRKPVFASDVREVLRQVAAGEVDAEFVYASDAAGAAQKVSVVQALQTSAPIAHLAHVAVASRQAALAEAFVMHLRGPAAQTVLKLAWVWSALKRAIQRQRRHAERGKRSTGDAGCCFNWLPDGLE